MVSVVILEIILFKQGIILLQNPFNKFNSSILFSSIILVIFLYNTSQLINFIDLGQMHKIIVLFAKVSIAIGIYIGTVRILYGKPLKEIFD